MKACEIGHVEIVSVLISKCADVNAKNEVSGRFHCFFILPSNFANTKYEETALIKACEKGHVEILSELILHGADVNAKYTVRRDFIIASI